MRRLNALSIKKEPLRGYSQQQGLSLSSTSILQRADGDESTRRLSPDQIPLAALRAADKAVIDQQLVT